MIEKLSTSRAEHIEHKAELIQAAAKHTATSPIFSIDLDKTLDTRIQLDALVLRVRKHMTEVLDESEMQRVSAIISGIDDCESALRGINTAIESAKPNTYGPREKADIARRSYSVLHQYATHRDWEVELNDVMILDPSRLELVEEPVTFVRAHSAAEPTYGLMPCPAFGGKPTGQPRLPKQLWPKVIDIYEECGEFGEIPGEEILASTN